ncbi:hypothetical protein [Chelativorans sp. Marseille-P2723]|uniref:hypothetical protein n=1 Tax=Chelativorans sp. Marseille-P2723 TaxID=2709133 RepID=UPI001570C036|nr:hypothetical protein [Chelativorans sp. Marseille-P2723]
MTFDGKAFGAQIVDAVKAHVSDVLAPVLRRLDAIEARQPEKGDKGDPGERGLDGAPGKDALPPSREQIVEAILSVPDVLDEAVQRYLADNPPPAGKDGRDGVDGAPGEKGMDGANGKDGRDGVGLAGALIDRHGNLALTLTDGSTRDLGPVVGKDGEPGRDGVDGVGFDDMTCDVRDDGVYLVWEKGETVKEARLPIPMDMGVYRSDATYKTGHCVTWGGSVWIARKDNPQGKPDAPDSEWRLAVKRGRDARIPQ